jgi:transaldolase
VDRQLQQLFTQAASDEQRAKLESLVGRIAIANAKMAYRRFKAVFYGERFARLRELGGRVQRPLWASTSTKNPAYPDVYYVETLIGPDTVNTLPPQTLKAFRDHGRVAVTIEDNLDQERARLAGLEEVGIRLDEVTAQVLDEGVTLFVQPFEKLIETIGVRCEEISSLVQRA